MHGRGTVIKPSGRFWFTFAAEFSGKPNQYGGGDSRLDHAGPRRGMIRRVENCRDVLARNGFKEHPGAVVLYTQSSMVRYHSGRAIMCESDQKPQRVDLSLERSNGAETG